jgi:hypothetical protein
MNCDQFDQLLDDYLDGSVDATRRAELDAHIEACPDCRAGASHLQELLDAVHQLPRIIDPPRDLWPEFASRLEPRTPRQFGYVLAWRRWAPLAAAALLLIAVTATVTYRLTKTQEFGALRTATIPASQASFAADRDFVVAAEDLERVLAERRERLSAKTVQIIEQNLAVIDAAIEEARHALESDPANADLRAMLWGAHRRKLDLLDQATRLTRS